MEGKIKYSFRVKMWRYEGTGGWYFVSVPMDISKEIRTHLKWQEEGWGRMKVKARIGQLHWETAIWFDSKLDTYLLPIKAEIRTKLNLQLNQTIEMLLWV